MVLLWSTWAMIATLRIVPAFLVPSLRSGGPAGKPGLETQILLILPDWGSEPEGSKPVTECRI